MFFVFSKVLDVAGDPLWWAAALALVSTLLGRRGQRRPAIASGVAALLVLVSFSSPLVADTLGASLEADAPQTWRPELTYDTVVLLGGVVEPSGSGVAEVGYNGNVERLLRVYELLRADQVKTVIVSGGPLSAGLPTEATMLKEQLTRWGIAPERVVLEARSRNTHENAAETQRLVAERGFHSVLLVTSAYHLSRALGCFRQVGLEPATLPVDFRYKNRGPLRLLPRAESLAESTRALHEWLGRAVYRVMGYSKGA